MFKLTHILIALSFSIILSSVYDSSNCSYSPDDSTCSNCIPYDYSITPDGNCSSCDSQFPNCQYCGENGCEQCNSGFNLISYDDQQYIVCEKYSSCKQYNFFYSRFGQKLKYCSMLANDNKSTILIILLAILISIVLLIALVIIIVFLIKKFKGQVAANENNTIIERHNKCSLCDKEKDTVNIDQDNTLPCGGFICTNCESKAKGCLSTGEYNKCLTCKKLVTWYAFNKIELQIQNQEVLNTNERLNPDNAVKDNNELTIPNKIEISNSGVCVVCLKSEPIPSAIIPCINKPKHKLHDSCLGEYYKNYYKGNKREALSCPICRTQVDI